MAVILRSVDSRKNLPLPGQDRGNLPRKTSEKNSMLNRLSVSALLKIVLLAASLWVVTGISIDAWNSWGSLQAAKRISVIADASADVFKAMNNMRVDRPYTPRQLLNDKPPEAGALNYLRELHSVQMAALQRA